MVRMMLVWWFGLMIAAWLIAAYVLWGTEIVVSREDDEGAESGEGRGG